MTMPSKHTPASDDGTENTIAATRTRQETTRTVPEIEKPSKIREAMRRRV
jgi:hypothetical protein